MSYPNAAQPISSLVVAGRPFEAWHPSVIDMLREHGTAAFAGYRYWMGLTTDSPEDCYLFGSNDGFNWAQHAQLTDSASEPAYNVDISGNGEWEEWSATYADIELAYDPTNNVIRVYYLREWPDAPATNLLRTTKTRTVNSSGVVSAESACSLGDGLHPNFVSPSVVRRGANDWVGFGVYSPNGRIVAYTSSDGVAFSGAITLADGASNQSCLYDWFGTSPWHMKAKLNSISNCIEILLSTRSGHFTGDQSLYHARASINSPYTLSVPFGTSPVLSKGSLGAWDDAGIYRSDFIITGSTEAGLSMEIYYNGMSQVGWSPIGDPKAQIGFTSIDPIADAGGGGTHRHIGRRIGRHIGRQSSQ